MKSHFLVYDKFAKKYDKFLLPAEQKFLAKWRREALGLLPENAKILEIGAGTGLNFQFYPTSRLLVASDISRNMLLQASEKSKDFLLVQADAENLPFEDKYFDAAVATLVFCSIRSPHKAFNELKRVVKKDGDIIFLEHVRPEGFLGYLFDLINFFTERLFQDCFNRQTAKLAVEADLEITKLSKKAFGIFNLIVCKNKD
ncbi:MAG: methyltransferase domain-containing protein [Pyrinomonadaceae bacterium]|nr:methyltransferase domain-containing protein [Pyrinomonadaceae bacterium]MCX7639104.1 methyltransferase domain-containing protein [Pyrinomonadaceae bacterium]